MSWVYLSRLRPILKTVQKSGWWWGFPPSTSHSSGSVLTLPGVEALPWADLQWFQLRVLLTEDAGTSFCINLHFGHLPQKSFSDLGLPVQGARTHSGFQWMLPNDVEDTLGHLPLRFRFLILSAEAGVCWPGPCAGIASPLSPYDNRGNRLGAGESTACGGPGLLEKFGHCHRWMVLSVGLKVT